ncbi:ADP-ribosylation factor GTPase-activating protein 2-like [Centruroides sculpturatus]|uniref:ADP-ribosylation factor GTPase-activating protein 2-like n=1 Tax=Centruroides sculpturatus TaxID=218467 RepID=UPI000C6DFAC5|nr:ADP-ribosylation factor GTPase-activating protein 2-like [Centruroides sculpturatus]
MSDQPDVLTKSDIATIFKRLRSIPSNKICFDCGAKNPTWASVTFGVFICMDCSAIHRSLGVHVSFVRSTQLDTSWTWQQIRAMQVGGNANAVSFLIHFCIAEHVNLLNLNAGMIVDACWEQLLGPSVEHLGTSPVQNEPRKSIIAARKPASKKGLGTKKGLGAQKVKTDFSEIEKEAQQTDQLKEQLSAKQNTKISKETEEKQLVSVRLAYQDLSLKKKQTEEKIRQVDPRKAEQLERLGMGFSSSSHGDVSHSAASNMTTITQDNPSSGGREKERDFDDDFEFVSFTSGPPKYGDSPFFSHSEDKAFSDYLKKGPWDVEKSDTKKSTTETILPLEKNNSYFSGRNRKEIVTSSSSTDEAQRKFGNAKAISSDQFFNNNFDSEYQRKSNLSRFEGSSSISSEDFFGESTRSPTHSYSGPNMYDIKEGVKDGVTKVASRLSNIANGVMSSLQEHYSY